MTIENQHPHPAIPEDWPIPTEPEENPEPSREPLASSVDIARAAEKLAENNKPAPQLPPLPHPFRFRLGKKTYWYAYPNLTLATLEIALKNLSEVEIRDWAERHLVQLQLFKAPNSYEAVNVVSFGNDES